MDAIYSCSRLALSLCVSRASRRGYLALWVRELAAPTPTGVPSAAQRAPAGMVLAHALAGVALAAAVLPTTDAWVSTHERVPEVAYRTA
jgi:hypothetical protein